MQLSGERPCDGPHKTTGGILKIFVWDSVIANTKFTIVSYMLYRK